MFEVCEPDLIKIEGSGKKLRARTQTVGPVAGEFVAPPHTVGARPRVCTWKLCSWFWHLSWDLIPGRKAPGCTCLVRMLHSLPCVLQTLDRAVLYYVLFSHCPSGTISHNITYNFQAVGCMMACVLWTFEVYDVERPWDVTKLLFI